MKLTKFFIAALAVTTLFASCAKEQGPEVTGKTQTIVVSLPDNVVGARGVEIAVPNSTTQPVVDTWVFLLNGNTVVGQSGIIHFDEYPLVMEQIPAEVNRVIVVANIPAENGADISDLSTAADILGFAYTIADQNIAGAAGANDAETIQNTLKTKTLIGDCMNLTTVTTDPGHTDPTHITKAAEVTLNALTARIEVGPLKKGAGFEELELVGVWINGFYTDGSKATTKTFTQSDMVWNTTPATGVSATNDWATVTIPTYTGYTPYFSAAHSDVKMTADGGKSAYAFHVFAGAVPHVILLVKGKYAPGYGVAGTPYFCGYITYTKFMEGTTEITSLAANKVYKLGADASGNWVGIDVVDPPITGDPESTDYDLALSIVVSPWTSISVTPKP